MFEVLKSFAQSQPDKLHRIARAVEAVDSPANLTLGQAYLLASVAHTYQPQVILDLGTGEGTSAAAFSAACPSSKICTFDFDNKWESQAMNRLRSLEVGANVQPFVGDLTSVDFGPIVGSATSVVIFWDAHGLEVADHVLAHIMPLVADRRHIVLCHDMSLASEKINLDYDGKPAWHGMQSWYDANGNMARVIIGWTMTIVDQVIPIVDFCARNKIAFRSVDADIHVENAQAVPVLSKLLGFERLQTFHTGYFSMNESDRRFFPAKLLPITDGSRRS